MDSAKMDEFINLVNMHVDDYNSLADYLEFGSVRHIRFRYIAMAIEEAAQKVETKYHALSSDLTDTEAYNILVKPIDELRESAKDYYENIAAEDESHSVNSTIQGYSYARRFLRKALIGGSEAVEASDN